MADYSSGSVFGNTQKLPPMSMADLSAMYNVLSKDQDAGFSQRMQGGPTMQQAQYQQQLQQQNAAQTLQNWLKTAQMFPSMQPTQGVQQAAGTLFQNPQQGLLQGLGLSQPQGNPIPQGPAWQDQAQVKLNETQMFANWLQNQPEPVQKLAAPALGMGGGTKGALTENEKLLDNMRKQKTIAILSDATVPDASLQNLTGVRPAKSIEELQKLAVFKGGKWDLTDPDIQAAAQAAMKKIGGKGNSSSPAMTWSPVRQWKGFSVREKTNASTEDDSDAQDV